MSFDRRAAKLEEVFSASAEADGGGEAARKKRVIEFLDICEERRRLEFSRPGCSRDELLELGIGRYLEKQGRSAKEISELLPAYVQRFERVERQFAEAREALSTDTGRFGQLR